MLEIRKNAFSKNYENIFFREFSRHLFNSFDEKNLSGVLIGSPLCEVDERLKIDVLLITSSVVCIIDFKNYRGKIKIPSERDFEFGLWTTESGEQIKGGSSINPFIQLKNQKRRFVEVWNKHIKKGIANTDIFNPFHLVRIVCFQEETEIIGDIPNSEALNFFILNKQNFLEKILDIVDVTDKDVKLTSNSFDAFKKVFRADQFKIDDKPLKDYLKDIPDLSVKHDYCKLNDDQKSVLKEIKSFLENPDQQVFILHGTINSGKSYLIPFIQDLAYNSAIQETEVFAASNRVAKNLFSSSGLEKVNSIYSFIYGGQKFEAVENEEVYDENIAENDEHDISDELPLEVVPMKQCDNSENALFIVDESQLVSDTYHQSIDLVFGTGYLLRDFLEFTGYINRQNKPIDNCKRKIIFIGDFYQLQLGKPEESPLNPSYLEENYKLKVSSFQLLDKEHFSDINKQSLTLVKSMKESVFNTIRFETGNQVSSLENDEKFTYVKKIIDANGHILTYSNEEAQKINQWIKKSIIKSGEDISKGDLVLFNNNISVEDESDPFAEPKKISNGQFAVVQNVSLDRIRESVKIKGESTILNFRELSLQLCQTGQQIKVISLENFRSNPKAELSKNEIIAFRAILNKAVNENFDFLRSKEFQQLTLIKEFNDVGGLSNEFIKKIIKDGRTKASSELEKQLKKVINTLKKNYRRSLEKTLNQSPSSKYYKYKNAALLRFGWAMTVHKSMSYKWEEVLFNVEPGESVGKANEHYFRWLYSGITRAKQNVYLINYKPFSPFEKTELRDRNIGVRIRDVFFHSDNENLNSRLDELKEIVSEKLFDHQFAVKNIEHFNWQERYFITNGINQEVVVSFTYNGQGNFRLPVKIGGDNTLYSKVLESLKIKSELKNFINIKDPWRKREYEKFAAILSLYKIGFEMILQTNYKDKIRLFSGNDELEIELDYGGDGMVSFITAKYYSDIVIWNNFQKAIDQIKHQ